MRAFIRIDAALMPMFRQETPASQAGVGHNVTSVAELRAIFDMIDVNHDGSVTQAEFIKALRHLPKVCEKLGLQKVEGQEGDARMAYQIVFGKMDTVPAPAQAKLQIGRVGVGG